MSISKEEEKELEALASEFLSGPLEEEEDIESNDSLDANQPVAPEIEDQSVIVESYRQAEQELNKLVNIALEFAHEKYGIHFVPHTFLLPCECFTVRNEEEGPVFEKGFCFLLVVILLLICSETI